MRNNGGFVFSLCRFVLCLYSTVLARTVTFTTYYNQIAHFTKVTSVETFHVAVLYQLHSHSRSDEVQNLAYSCAINTDSYTYYLSDIVTVHLSLPPPHRPPSHCDHGHHVPGAHPSLFEGPLG